MFDLVHTNSSQLWDYGWFDLTRFRATDELERVEPSTKLLDSLVRSDLYSRSFCKTPDPWGATDYDHGPYALRTLGAEAFRPISHSDLVREIESILGNPTFASRPSQDQLAPVQTWVNWLRRPGLDLFMLAPSDAAAGSLASLGIWLVFHEFAGVERGAGEISVGVIGYD